jgi:hypothetical protein
MRWLTGLLLLGASILKAFQLVSDPSLLGLSTTHRSLLTLQVVVEYGIALIVLSGLYWQQIRWVLIALFGSFAVYSLFLVISGEQSCGCFGAVKVPPQWTFLLDCVIILGLLWSATKKSQVRRLLQICLAGRVAGIRCQSGKALPSSKVSSNNNADVMVQSTSLISLVSSFFAITTVFFLYLLFNQNHAPNGLIFTANGLVILKPEEWVGQQLPISQYIDIDLSQGHWTVVLHRHDCVQCQKLLPKYEALALTESVALIEVPPFDDSKPTNAAVAHGRLAVDRDWFVQTPVEITLNDGIVLAAGHKYEQ